MGDAVRGGIPPRIMDAINARITLLPTGCWQWTGAMESGLPVFGGHPRLNIRRALYEQKNGSCPPRLVATCGDARCVNPDHAGTRNQRAINGRGEYLTPDGRVNRAWIKTNPSTGCWWWLGAVSGNGYPVIRLPRNQTPNEMRVRPLLAREEGLSVPAEKRVRSSCRNKACVNPAHLVWERGTN